MRWKNESQSGGFYQNELLQFLLLEKGYKYSWQNSLAWSWRFVWVLCSDKYDILISQHTVSVVVSYFTNTYRSNHENKILQQGWACLVAAKFVCRCCSEPHQSPTSVSAQHGQPLSPPLSLPLSSSLSSAYLPPSSVSLSSHTWKPAWLMPVKGTSFTVRTRAERRERGGFQIKPMNTHKHTHTQLHPPVPTAWARAGHWRWGTGHSYSPPTACQLQTLSSGNLQAHRRIMCVYVCVCVCVCVCVFSCFELWLQEVSGLQPMVKGLPDPPPPPFSPVRWNTAGRLPYH